MRPLMRTRIRAVARPTDAARGGEVDMNRVFAVTGATGFLGSHLMRRLLADGHSVRLLVRQRYADEAGRSELLEGLDENERRRCTFIVGDINDDGSVRELLLRGTGSHGVVDGVFHLAGVVKHSRRKVMTDETMRVNVGGALQVVKTSVEAMCPRCVVASTSGTVAVRPQVRRAGDRPSGTTRHRGYAEDITRRWPYYVSKIEMEKQIGDFITRAATAPEGGAATEIVYVRPSLLLGPGDLNMSSCGTVNELLNESLPLVPTGTLNFVDVRDAADATAAAMYRGKPGKAYLLGAANMSTAKFFEEVTDRAGVRMPFIKLPAWLTVALAVLIDAILKIFRKWRPALDPVLAEMGSADWSFESEDHFDEMAASAFHDLGFSPREWGDTIDDTIVWLRRARGSGTT